MAGYDNPQITFTYDTPSGAPPACIACGRPVDPVVGYFALWAGTLRRPDLIAAAHANLWEGPGEDDVSPWCEDRLRHRWYALLGEVGAGTLEEGTTGDGMRFLLQGEEVDPGVPMEMLTAEGVWLSGGFEYQRRPHLAAIFHLALGGWDGPTVTVAVPGDAVVRRSAVHR